MFRKKLSKKGGFTLIELIVVIAILGILVAIIAPNFIRYTQTAREAASEASIESAVRAIQILDAMDATINRAAVEEYLSGTLTDAEYSAALTRSGIAETPSGT